MARNSPAGSNCLSPKLVWQIVSHGGTAARLLFSSLPEDPTWTVAFVGAGLTVAYFYLRSKEERATERQETMPEIVARDRSVFYPREDLAQYIYHFLNHSSSRCLLVAGPKNSGTTLLVSELLTRSTLCLDSSQPLKATSCAAQRKGDGLYKRTSSRVGIRSRCWVGLQGLVTTLQSNFASNKFSSIISFIRNLIGSIQGTAALSLEELNELHAFREVGGDGAELLHQLKIALKICLNDVIPYAHTLFLDDLETYSELASSWPETGRHAKKIMLESMKILSKNCRNISVIGGCSPAMCFDVLHDLHFKDYYGVCFVGDLSMDNARSMFNHLWAAQCGVQNKLPPEVVFTEVYELVGGRVSDIRDMVLHLVAMQRLRGSCSPKSYPCISRESTRLLQLLDVSGTDDGSCGEDDGGLPIDVCKPAWNSSQVAGAFSAILNSGNSYGCVPLPEMLQVVGGHKVLRSMFEHDVLLYRPQCPVYEDFEENQFSDCVAPYSPLTHYCMRSSCLAERVREVLAAHN
mmetsp:Transcript_16336/g.45532  ORF Transcript_16336/g.45532 Transcript_16336/m.45532 type:complete len:519 (+) Transcript_16336:235-1791(+)